MHRSFPFTAFRVRMTRSRIWRLRPRRSPANAGASWEVQPATTPSDSERVQRTTAASHSEGVLRTTAASHSEGVLRTTEESLHLCFPDKVQRSFPSTSLRVRMTRLGIWRLWPREHAHYPPAIAPTMSSGSRPSNTLAGSGVSAGRCDRSCSHAKKRRNGRRTFVW